jgi:hypothetical protein
MPLTDSAMLQPASWEKRASKGHTVGGIVVPGKGMRGPIYGTHQMQSICSDKSSNEIAFFYLCPMANPKNEIPFLSLDREETLWTGPAGVE